ncbi:uncharacterized protein LOC114530996 [Dendronephthya gigantea]|uniref:uncharacterized protein LOC114530996 n=1 Tax=Dendronephthya gigantea TaxID=151771 RepID=UPI00106B64C0|nr:uncharacterized protein LOC114530996 [Dendronephthya gigantea]
MIYIIARNQDQRIQQLNRSLEHNHPRDDDAGRNVAQSRTSHNSNKAAKTIGLLLAVYVVSWLPVNVYRLQYRWLGGDHAVYHKWIKIINLLIQLHSCLNPWLFVARSKDMKLGIAKFLPNLGICLASGQPSSSANNVIASYIRNDNSVRVDGKLNGHENNASGDDDSKKVQKLKKVDETYSNNTSNSSGVSSGSIDDRNDRNEEVKNVDEIGEKRINCASNLNGHKDRNIKEQTVNCSAQSQSEPIKSQDVTKFKLGKENLLMDKDEIEENTGSPGGNEGNEIKDVRGATCGEK